MPAVKYVIYGCSSLRRTPGVISIQELHTGGKTLLHLLLQDRVIDDNLKRQIVYLQIIPTNPNFSLY